ncbi:hypothetical protein ACQCSX_00320 [Pseudarthrobacter sp. P1]|uniref:hypothetical protein n=1 Tax=Pseudarthrobacter sp. P1 TaxID=3418418 RepID=UPI003CF124E3
MVSQPEPNSWDSPADDNDDAVWRDLVARLEAVDGDDVFDVEAGRASGLGGGTPAPDGGTDAGAPDAPAPAAPAAPPAPPGPAGFARAEHLLPPPGPRDYEAEDDDGEFVPEDPPSLANAEPALVLAWIGTAGGPIALLLTALLWRTAPLTVVVGIIVAFVACAGYLVYRLPGHRDDDGDDGAVV